MRLISDQQKALIETAIRDLEQRTSGELVCVIASSSDNYRYIPLLWAALLALAALPLTELLFPWLTFLYLYAVQLSCFFGSWTVLKLPVLRRLVIPTQVQHRRASRFAHECFLNFGIHNTRHRAGIMLFVSAEEHYVELIADQGIARYVDQEVWQEAIKMFIKDVNNGEITQGFLNCIERCSQLLEAKFPRDADVNKAELPDVLLEIDHDYFG